MNNSEILKKYLGEYLLLVDNNWENSINDMPAPVAFEFTKCYIEQMFESMPDYELEDVKNKLSYAENEMK